MIRFCARCLYPETKPDLWFDDRGVCSACIGFEGRKAVDWDDRKKQFTELTGRYRSKNGNNYDCIVPVSGGKDSTYQVIRLLQHGLNPLCVTSMTDSLSDIGRVSASMRVVLPAEVHLRVVVFLKGCLGGNRAQRQTSLEGVRLRNFLAALQIVLPVDETERLFGTFRPDRRYADPSR